MLTTGFNYPGSAAVRYPRGVGTGIDAGNDLDGIEIGKGIVRQKGEKIALLAFGSLVSNALIVGEEMKATVVDMRFVKPLDKALILEISKTHSQIITLEENAVAGGAGSAVSEFLSSQNIQIAVKHIGIPDEFIEHGDPADLFNHCRLDVNGIKEQIKEIKL